MKILPYIFFYFALAITMLNCSQKTENEPTTPSLKNVFQEDFYIGAALRDYQINGEDTAATRVIQSEFSSITPENVMKSINIHPTRDSFSFEMADKLVEIGEENDMFIVGHALVWHSQLSPYMEEISDSAEMSIAIKEHIEAIAGRYKGRIQAWDVVNEALNEDGTFRESLFYKVMGEDYIKQAFDAAAKAAPDAELYYNDYNIEQPEKRKGVIELIKKLQASGTKIDGIGIQGHWSLLGASVDVIEEAIIDYSKLGLKVMFTELDITVLPNPWELEGADVDQNYEGSPFMNPYTEGMPDSAQVQLAERYTDLFNLFLKHSDKVSRITFWGINDGQSWLNYWPIKDRTNHPLLFDRNYQPKKAYYEVLKLKNEPQNIE